MSNTIDLKKASLAELTAEYNRIAEYLGKPAVKSFKDKETAVKRLGSIRGLEAVQKAADKAKEKSSAKDKPKAKAKKAAPTEKDLLGEDEDPKPKKAAPTEKDLLGDDDEDEEPKPKKKSKKAVEEKPRKIRGKNSLEKGKEPTFNHEPFSIQKEPREGTFRAKVLSMLEAENGTTVTLIENAFTKYWEKKGISPKVDLHLRALEMIRLLRYQNGFGFEERDGRIFALRAPAKK